MKDDPNEESSVDGADYQTVLYGNGVPPPGGEACPCGCEGPEVWQNVVCTAGGWRDPRVFG